MSHPTGIRRGYTLIELLVVIALIGLLIAILTPSLKRSMDLATSTVCQYNLREIGHGLMEYRIENDGWLPLPDEVSVVASSRPTANTSWFVKLFPTYMPDPLTLMCPDDPFGYRLADDQSHLTDAAVAEFPSYGLNSFIIGVGGGYLAHVDRKQPTRPHDTILVADLGPDRMNNPRRSRPSSFGPTRNGSLMMWNDGFDPFSGLPANPWVTMRHHDGINMLTLTGGVRHVRTEPVLRTPIRRFYDDCAAGGCTLCRYFKVFHYSFAKEHLYWWTGPLPPK